MAGMESTSSSRFSEIKDDLNPRSWLSVYRKNSFTYVSLMFLFYSALGLLAATIVWTIEFSVFNFEEPSQLFTLLGAISAGPSEEALFFGIPFALTGNTYVVLFTGSIWAAAHLFNYESFFQMGNFSYTTFAFVIPHIFFSLRAWKSGKGLHAVFLHSSWNVVIFGLLVLFGEISFSLYSSTSTWSLLTDAFTLVSALVLLAITIPIYKWRLRREKVKIKAEREDAPRHVKILIALVLVIIFVPVMGGAAAIGFLLVAMPFSDTDYSTPKIPETVNGLKIGEKVGLFVIDDVTNKIYVNSFGMEKNPEIIVIDGDSNKILEKFLIDIPLTRPLLTIQPSTNFLFISDNYGDYTDYKSKLHVIDLETKKVISSFDFVGNSWPIAFVENPDIAYVNHVTHGSISVIDVAKNSIIKKIFVGTNPSGLSVNPNNNLVYSSSYTSEAITIIDGASHEKIDTISFEYGPGDMVIDQKNKPHLFRKWWTF